MEIFKEVVTVVLHCCASAGLKAWPTLLLSFPGKYFSFLSNFFDSHNCTFLASQNFTNFELFPKRFFSLKHFSKTVSYILVGNKNFLTFWRKNLLFRVWSPKHTHWSALKMDSKSECESVCVLAWVCERE